MVILFEYQPVDVIMLPAQDGRSVCCVASSHMLQAPALLNVVGKTLFLVAA